MKRLALFALLVMLLVSIAAPAALAQGSDPFVFSVGVDNRHGGYLATTHLIARGHRHIAYVASSPDRSDNSERLAGYRQALTEAGFDPVYGARPLKRAIQQQIENPLAKEILGGKYAGGDTVKVTASGGEIAFAKG